MSDPCSIAMLPSGYLNIAMENGHRNSEFSHEKWWIFPWLFLKSSQPNMFSPDDVTASSPQMPDSECAVIVLVEFTKKK